MGAIRAVLYYCPDCRTENMVQVKGHGCDRFRLQTDEIPNDVVYELEDTIDYCDNCERRSTFEIKFTPTITIN